MVKLLNIAVLFKHKDALPLALTNLIRLEFSFQISYLLDYNSLR